MGKARPLRGRDRAAHALVLLGSNVMAAGLLSLGIVCIVAPTTAAKLYGISINAEDAASIAWVRVAGVRDAGLALATWAIFALHRPALRVFMPALLPIPVADALLTLSSDGTVAGAAAHLFGMVAIFILTLMTWLDPTLRSTPPSYQLVDGRAHH